MRGGSNWGILPEYQIHYKFSCLRVSYTSKSVVPGHHKLKKFAFIRHFESAES